METARVTNWWSHTKTVTLIWFIYFILFYSFFHMALKNSSQIYPSSGSNISNGEQRARLYDKMARDLDENGPVFLKEGETSQSLSLSNIFSIKDGAVKPVHKAANPPVRANVLYLSPKYSVPISEAVKHIFNPHFDNAIWFQNSSLYHFSMFHASHHISPVPATEEEIEAEASAVRAVAEGLCPLKVVLDRVVLTSTGVLLGCWQVISGTDPITIRAKLRTALPRAPEKQLANKMLEPTPQGMNATCWVLGLTFSSYVWGSTLNEQRLSSLDNFPASTLAVEYDPAILHTSFARLLGHPTTSPKEPRNTSDQLHFFHELVDSLNNQIRGTEAVVSELWNVEEYDVLALALDGRMKVRKFPLGCSSA